MMQVPCGHCIGCLRKKQNDWSIRISEQLKQSPLNCFVTLTYRDDTVPYGIDSDSGQIRKSLRKDDYQKFLKVLRSNLNRKGVASPSFFVCGEYGSRTFRPHYHIVVCGANTSLIESALDYWRDRHGFVLSKDIGISQKDRQCVGMYVGKYCSKGVFIEQSPLMVDFIEKPFCEASHFLGRKYIVDRIEYFSLLSEKKSYPSFDSFVDDFQSNFVYRNGDFSYSMPRYYKDYFFSHTPSDFLPSIQRKTSFNPLKEQINIKLYGFPKGQFKSTQAIVVPSFRDALALSLYHLDCSEYWSAIGECNDSASFETAIKLVDEKLSQQCTFLESETRKLDGFYLRSKL